MQLSGTQKEKKMTCKTKQAFVRLLLGIFGAATMANVRGNIVPKYAKVQQHNVCHLTMVSNTIYKEHSL